MEYGTYAESRKKGDVMNSRPRFHGNKYVDALPDIDQQLENALMMGDLSWVKDCVKKGANVNCRCNLKGSTPLMLAIEGGWPSIVEYLVEKTPVDLELTDSGGFNACDLAAMYGYLSEEERGINFDIADIVNYLKGKGLEYTWRGAIIGADLDRINEYLENGQDIEQRVGYYTEGNYQMTATQMAVKYGQMKIARYLMVLGAVLPRDICPWQLPYETDVFGFS
mmetsp:Transcript_64375/g.122808  ORF Transcript_64375/g.122808 Transcript_64375/m.122808 type:complete len:223 (-) Transcript_64375:80-748(-)